MVPLLIHLPPISDDVESKGRDSRDIADENISKAEVLYNIIASTAQQGFKSKFYGQRHISFEIVAHGNSVNFYSAVPVALVSVVEQAILSAYPNSRVEEVAEHNIFSPVGKIGGTTGGELVLKESFVYPIATFQDTKRDAIQSILNALSKLENDDGAGLQILLRPAHSSWVKTATTEATTKREGKKSKKGLELAFWWIKQIFIAPLKPPEAKDSSGGDPQQKPGSNLDQSIADAIEEKTKSPGYEVTIRVIASSDMPQKSQAILSNLVASFAMFDAPGKNGFKYIPAKDMQSFVTAYILRFFPPEQRFNVLNVVELATIFHFPDGSNIPTTQLERQLSKQTDGPRNMLDGGLLLGYNVFRGVKKEVRLNDDDRRRHMYVVGQTGTGKSKFQENMALQDMLEGRGFAFLDPHGDSAELLLGLIPKERTEDVIYFCPADMDYPMGLNLFEYKDQEQKDFLIQETINMLYKLYDPQKQGIIGPRYEHIFRNCALLLMSDPNGGTFIDIPKLLVDPDFMKQKLKFVTDKTVIDFWTKEFPASQRSNEAGEVTSWVVAKFGAFLSNTMMRNIIGQTKSSFDIREIMDSGKIFIVNLSKGRTGELNSKLLGMIFIMKFQAAAMSRANTDSKNRRDFCLYVDEFQNFQTDSFESILSEARKYGLNLIVANQFITQLSDEIREAIFGNIGTVIAHRVGTADAELLEKLFRPVFDVDDLQRLPTANSIVRTLIKGVPTQPFSMADLPILMLGKSNKQLADALKQLSAAKYGRPKSVVETEIFKRLTTEEPVPNKPDLAAFGDSRLSQPGATVKAGGQSQSSFLDDWLAKRRAVSGKPADQKLAPPTDKVRVTEDNGTSSEANPNNISS
ncbi:MAG: type IV secretory system conjugative DNA transfer family protein, partial [Candidatus Saccharibacteria bacterium]